MSTQGQGLKKQNVALLASCGIDIDMQVFFYAGAVGGSASYYVMVMGGAKHPIECVRVLLFNQKIRSFSVALLSFRLQGSVRRARRSRAVARHRPSGRCAALLRSCLCACLLGIVRFP